MPRHHRGDRQDATPPGARAAAASARSMHGHDPAGHVPLRGRAVRPYGRDGHGAHRDARAAPVVEPALPHVHGGMAAGTAEHMGGGMAADLLTLSTRDESGAFRVVVESPRGAAVKLKYSPELGAFCL